MVDLGSAVFYTILIVGVVLLGVAALSIIGARTAARPPSPKTMRRIANGSILLGTFMLGFAVASALFGQLSNWLLPMQAILLIAVGWQMRRDQRAALRYTRRE